MLLKSALAFCQNFRGGQKLNRNGIIPDKTKTTIYLDIQDYCIPKFRLLQQRFRLDLV